MVAIRQPSEDKEFWHWEMEKEEIVGGVVSGAEEEELELDEDDEPASSAGKLELLDEEEDELDDDDDSLAELDESADEDEPAELAEKDEPAEEAETAPVPPPPKPGIIVVANFGWPTSMSRFRLDIDVSSSAGNFFSSFCKTKSCFCISWRDSSASFILFPVNLPR